MASMLSGIGQLLLWLGFVAAAFATVYRLELPGDDKWPTIWWNLYAAAMAIGIVGVVLLRAANRAHRSHSGRVAIRLETLQRSLQLLGDRLTELAKIAEERRPSAIVRFIDDHCVGLFTEFADARQALAQQYGLDVFAEVMSPFASAERFVNRSWSAAADGYLDEATESIDKARRFLAAAASALAQAESTV